MWRLTDTNSINYYFCAWEFLTICRYPIEASAMTSLSTFHVRCDFDLQSRKYGVKSLREFNRPKQHWYFIHLIVDLMLNQIGRGNFLVPMCPAAMHIKRKLSNDFYLMLDSALLYFNLYDVADLMFKIEKVIFRDLCCEYFRNAHVLHTMYAIGFTAPHLSKSSFSQNIEKL